MSNVEISTESKANKVIEDYKQKLKDFEIIANIILIENIRKQYDKNERNEKLDNYILNVMFNGNNDLYGLIKSD